MAETLFDVLGNINKKKYEWDEAIEKIYTPFMANRNFGNIPDVVFAAAEMDLASHIDKKLQHDFYYYLLPKKNRFGKWEKAEKTSTDEEMIIACYNVNRTTAQKYIRVLDASNPKWRDEFAEALEKGGKRR